MTNSKSPNPKRQSTHRRFSDSSQNDNASDSLTSSNLPYVHIAPFPTFLGVSEECPDAHLTRFEKVCRANNADTIDAMARIFPVTLLGEASLWYDLNVQPYYHDLSWDDIKTSFSEAFGSPEVAREALLSELAAMRQGEEESVRSYLLRMQRIMRKLKGFEFNEKMVCETFVSGLRGEFGDLGLGKEGSLTLSEAVRLALGDGKNKRQSQSQSQCQCWKHQCWKKNGVRRNLSGVTQNHKGD